MYVVYSSFKLLCRFTCIHQKDLCILWHTHVLKKTTPRGDSYWMTIVTAQVVSPLIILSFIGQFRSDVGALKVVRCVSATITSRYWCVDTLAIKPLYALKTCAPTKRLRSEKLRPYNKTIKWIIDLLIREECVMVTYYCASPSCHSLHNLEQRPFSALCVTKVGFIKSDPPNTMLFVGKGFNPVEC